MLRHGIAPHLLLIQRIEGDTSRTRLGNQPEYPRESIEHDTDRYIDDAILEFAGPEPDADIGNRKLIRRSYEASVSIF